MIIKIYKTHFNAQYLFQTFLRSDLQQFNYSDSLIVSVIVLQGHCLTRFSTPHFSQELKSREPCTLELRNHLLANLSLQEFYMLFTN